MSEPIKIGEVHKGLSENAKRLKALRDVGRTDSEIMAIMHIGAGTFKEFDAELREAHVVPMEAMTLEEPQSRRKRKQWTTQEITRLKTAKAEGKTNREIADALDRTEGTVAVKISELRKNGQLPQAEPKPRQESPLSAPEDAGQAIAALTRDPVKDVAERTHEASAQRSWIDRIKDSVAGIAEALYDEVCREGIGENHAETLNAITYAAKTLTELED